MLIPGDPLWNPRQPYRLPGSHIANPVEVTARKLLRIVAWFVVAWAIWLWVSDPVIEQPCSGPLCVTTTTN